MIEQFTETKSRLLAKIIRGLLQSEPFETLADLIDALKWRCAKLKIRFTNDELNYALTLLRSNIVLVNEEIQASEPSVTVEHVDPSVISHSEAQQLLNALRITARTMPAEPTWNRERRRVDR